MTKIIFFDGDGTLWYPTMTKRTAEPHKIYFQDSYRDGDFAKHFELTPKTKESLVKLKEGGVMLVLLSTHNTDDKISADDDKVRKAKALGIDHLFDRIESSPNRREGKGEKIEQILRELSIDKNHALMVGDLYNWDYKPAVDVGVKALLLHSDYQDEYALAHGVSAGDFINDLSDLLERV